MRKSRNIWAGITARQVCVGLLAILLLALTAGTALAATAYKTVALQGVSADNGHAYNLQTIIPEEVNGSKTVVHDSASEGIAVIVMDKVGVAVELDTKSPSAEVFLKTTKPRIPDVVALGHGIWFGKAAAFGPDPQAYVYAVSLGQKLNFALVLPGITAAQNSKLRPIVETILEHTKSEGEAK